MKSTGIKGTCSYRQPFTWKRFFLSLLALALAPLEQFVVMCYANHKGSEGTVKIGSNAVAEIRGWSVDEAANTIDDTTLNDAADTHQLGTTSWTAEITCFWDETDTQGQGAMDIGASVTLNLYPEGATTGDTYYTGTATITAVRRSGSVNNMVEAVYSCKGSGALTESTAA